MIELYRATRIWSGSIFHAERPWPSRTVEGIEVLGTPLGTDTYIKAYMAQNCLKIIRDVEKHDPLTDGFVHNQLMKLCMNTRTQYECKHDVTSPRVFLIGTAPVCRYCHRECNPSERRSGFIPTLWHDTRYNCSNIWQGWHDIYVMFLHSFTSDFPTSLSYVSPS